MSSTPAASRNRFARNFIHKLYQLRVESLGYGATPRTSISERGAINLIYSRPYQFEFGRHYSSFTSRDQRTRPPRSRKIENVPFSRGGGWLTHRTRKFSAERVQQGEIFTFANNNDDYCINARFFNPSPLRREVGWGLETRCEIMRNVCGYKTKRNRRSQSNLPRNLWVGVCHSTSSTTIKIIYALP